MSVTTKRRNERVLRGFSYAETLLAILILTLCSGFVCDAMGYGLRHLRERTRRAYAVVLLDNLCAAVRNDLQYATECASDRSFKCVVLDYETKKDYDAITWYGVGQWRADDPQSYFDADAIQWREIGGENVPHGQIIRKTKLVEGDFFDCAAPPECYAGYGAVKSGLYAGLEIEREFSTKAANKIERFTVAVRIYDGPDGDARILAQREFAAIPVQLVSFRDG